MRTEKIVKQDIVLMNHYIIRSNVTAIYENSYYTYLFQGTKNTNTYALK